MLEDHARIAALIDQAGEIVGRKKLQKMVYILQRTGAPFHETYHFHFYGPYSEELSVQLEELYNFGFLAEEKEKKSGTLCYRYRLTESGETFLKRYSGTLPDLTDLTEKLNRESVSFLELVSLLLYFDQLPRESAIEKVHQMRKNCREEDIQRAFVFISALNRTLTAGTAGA
ncbi:hypothetical protein EWI07_03405 [Sporolactobacillus sp. THM7-4]|nr:hypothetical protein EWI07_03405 [Sporolactobacillus sp. THM7-4]